MKNSQLVDHFIYARECDRFDMWKKYLLQNVNTKYSTMSDVSEFQQGKFKRCKIVSNCIKQQEQSSQYNDQVVDQAATGCGQLQCQTKAK